MEQGRFSPWRWGLLLALVEILVLTGVVWTEQVAFGRIGLLFPALSIFLSAFCFFMVLAKISRIHVELSRAAVLRIGVGAGGSVWLIAAILYGLAYMQWTEYFDFSLKTLFLIAPIIAMAPGVAVLILTFCAGDTALMLFGSPEEKAPFDS